MELTWYGLSCFRLTERGQASIVTDPYNGRMGLPALKLRADVVTVSHNAKGHNQVSAVTGKPKALVGPGEYEIGGVFITGVATHKNDDAPNVLYLIDYGSLTVAHLGDMKTVPTQAQIEALDQVNVLLVPVGGGNSLNASQAAELVSMMEPNIVIPMHYAMPNLKVDLEGVERFLKEMGVNDAAEETSLKVSASSLPEETQTVLLQPKL